MRVTVCQLDCDPGKLEREWEALASHVAAERSELVLLPEMPFYEWLPETADVDPARWEDSVRAHDAWSQRLAELEAAVVLATRSVTEGGSRYNQSLIWTARDGERPEIHRKRYLPDEGGFWEASWYSRGDTGFDAVQVEDASVGFLICSELWFFPHAKEYGRQGVQLLVNPRATLAPSVDKWVAGGRSAAVVAGAYCLSSNRAGVASLGEWGGAGWIVEPEEGDVLGVTTREQPFLTLDVDLSMADAAKGTYPRYVRE